MFDLSVISKKLDQAIDEKGIKTNVIFEFTTETYTSLVLVMTIGITIYFLMYVAVKKFVI